jgi:hypothetical protein
MQGKSTCAISACASTLLVLLIALWLRLPFVSTGLPYFYNEDEAHHFNRTVEMVKSGDYNPHYFHKPSLHFYLRMPAVALGFLWSVREGHIRSVKEIKTRDSHGLGGYEFTASHPGIVKWNRSLSLILSLGLIVVTGALARSLRLSEAAGLASMLLCAFSPELVGNSAVIAVDVLMALNTLIAIWLCIRLTDRYSTCGLALAGVFAGLAFSSKYNALPVCGLPLLAALVLRRFDPLAIAVAVSTPIAGFIAGSPYALPSLPLFLDQFAYEIWHYGIAGHEGHTAEPGLAQLGFYLRWFAGDAIGLGALVMATLGSAALFIPAVATEEGDSSSARRSRGILFLAFPALFFAMMCGQRANFTRNVLVLIPVLALLAMSAIELIARRFGPAKAVLWILTSILCVQPLIKAIDIRMAAVAVPESRNDLLSAISGRGPQHREVAIAADLQMPPSLFVDPSIRQIESDKLDPAALYLKGVDLIAIPAYRQIPGDQARLLKLEKEFPGASEEQRVVTNPGIRLYSFGAATAGLEAREAALSLAPAGSAESKSSCPPEHPDFFAHPDEPYCWIGTRLIELEIANPGVYVTGRNVRVTFRAMSPFSGQKAEITIGDQRGTLEWSGTEAGAWKDLAFDIEGGTLVADKFITIRTAIVAEAPAPANSTRDRRLLGIAISNPTVIQSPR